MGTLSKFIIKGDAKTVMNIFRRILLALTPDEFKAVKKEINKIDIGAHDISDRGVKFISGWEGFYSQPYNCPAGHATIGYGKLLHYGRVNAKDVTRWGTITQTSALRLLKDECKKCATAVNISLKVPVCQSQFDALVSFVYNVGAGGFKRSTLLRVINKKKSFDIIEKWFLVWNKISKNGKLEMCPGLKNRRQAEFDLYATGKYE